MKRDIYEAIWNVVEVCLSAFPLSSGSPHLLPQQSGIESSNPSHAYGQAVCFAAGQGLDVSETYSQIFDTPTWY